MPHKFKIYIQNDNEYFEYGTEDYPLRKEFLFGETLIDFLYLDLAEFKAVYMELGEKLKGLRTEKKPEYYGGLLAELGKMAEKHIYLELTYGVWADRLEEALEKGFNNVGKLLPEDELIKLPYKASLLQKQVKELFTQVLDIDSGREALNEKLTAYYKAYTCEPNKVFQFKDLKIKFEMVQGKEFSEVLYPNDIYDIIGFFVKELIRREQRLRVCKNCGKYFVLRGRSNVEYCDRSIDGGEKTCRDMGAINIWNRKKNDDEVFKLYRREYKRRFGWIKAGKIASDEFYKWSEAARERKTKCDDGEISFEEFKAWLKK